MGFEREGTLGDSLMSVGWGLGWGCRVTTICIPAAP